MVVIPVLLFSLVESKLILPAHLKHCSHLGDKTKDLGRFSRFQRFFADGLERFIIRQYRPVLNWALVNRYTSISLFIGFLVVFLALIFGERIGYRQRPSVPRDTTTITLQMPAGTTFETVAEIVPGKSMPTIRRVDRKRIIQVNADGDTDKLDIEAIEVGILEDYLPELAATKYQGLEFDVRDGRRKPVKTPRK